MDNRDLVLPSDDDPAVQADKLDAGDIDNRAGGALIAANLAGVNTGISTVTTAAPNSGNLGGLSADRAEAVVSGEDDADAVNLDVLEQFGSKNRETGDQGVSTEQSEVEASELNG